jgi:hypothetical protein
MPVNRSIGMESLGSLPAKGKPCQISSVASLGIRKDSNLLFTSSLAGVDWR